MCSKASSMLKRALVAPRPELQCVKLKPEHLRFGVQRHLMLIKDKKVEPTQVLTFPTRKLTFPESGTLLDFQKRETIAREKLQGGLLPTPRGFLSPYIGRGKNLSPQGTRSALACRRHRALG